MDKYQWEASIDGGRPGLCSYFEKGEETVEYCRYSEEGIEPLIYWRSFDDNKQSYFEVSEEFRLYFDLYEDSKDSCNKSFIYTDDNGDEDLAIIIEDEKVQIKLKYLKKFLSVKKMCLVLYFSLMRFSKKTLIELKQKEIDNKVKEDNYIYSICVRDLDIIDTKTQGWLLGKKIIFGIKDFELDTFYDGEKNKCENFIIGIDEDGNDILHTCEEKKLANFFGKNPGSPQFLKPIFFKKEVLKKYYDNPKKYTVDDGYLRCQGYWGLRMDNNHPEYIVVFLGDLGKLNYKEQLYWKSFNISHEGSMSQTAWERGFEAKFTDPDSPDLYFKYKFKNFQNKWNENFGWYLFKPLSKDDKHYFKSLHIPTTDDPKEFDEQILAISKIIIESLNVKKLQENIEIVKAKPSKLDILDCFLESRGVRFDGMFDFLNNLRLLKNPISHRKSKKDKG